VLRPHELQRHVPAEDAVAGAVDHAHAPAPRRPVTLAGKRAAGSPETGILAAMARLIQRPAIVQAAGNKPKRIEEFVGRVNSGDAAVSVARMTSPGGWQEPGQTPEFDEYTLVLRGMLRVEARSGTIDVRAGQAVVAPAGEWVRYGTPEDGGAEYVAVCVPAFSPDTVHRDA
jgi:mannose-6-phosphate isomerase-like protein (cupin superfamily)